MTISANYALYII